jgi:hypothetical protein
LHTPAQLLGIFGVILKDSMQWLAVIKAAQAVGKWIAIP